MQPPPHLSLASAAAQLPPGPHGPQVSSSPPPPTRFILLAEEEGAELRGLDSPHGGGLGSQPLEQPTWSEVFRKLPLPASCSFHFN